MKVVYTGPHAALQPPDGGETIRRGHPFECDDPQQLAKYRRMGCYDVLDDEPEPEVDDPTPEVDEPVQEPAEESELSLVPVDGTWCTAEGELDKSVPIAAFMSAKQAKQLFEDFPEEHGRRKKILCVVAGFEAFLTAEENEEKFVEGFMFDDLEAFASYMEG